MLGWNLKQNATEFTNVEEKEHFVAEVVCRLVADELESRRLWFGVTQNLIGGNVEEATNQKSKLEQKQRDDASAREKNNVVYHPQVSPVHLIDSILSAMGGDSRIKSVADCGFLVQFSKF